MYVYKPQGINKELLNGKALIQTSTLSKVLQRTYMEDRDDDVCNQVSNWTNTISSSAT